MFQRILVAADTLGHSSRALYVAQQLATRIHAQLLVLHVERNNTFFELTADERELRSAVRSMRAQGLDARFVLDYGRPEDCIVTTIARERVDLVVMAPHNRGLIESMRRPSVTQYVLSQGTVPVLAWPQHLSPELDAVLLHTPGSLVIVPLDGSARAEEALPLAAELAGQFGRGLLLLRIIPTSGDAANEWIEPSTEHATEHTEERARAVEFEEAGLRAYLAGIRERLIAAYGDRTPVETMVKRGDPTGEIAHTAALHPGSVVVMSTHGRSELARLVLGSVTEGVIRSAPTPVLIVPHKVAVGARSRALASL